MPHLFDIQRQLASKGIYLVEAFEAEFKNQIEIKGEFKNNKNAHPRRQFELSVVQNLLTKSCGYFNVKWQNSFVSQFRQNVSRIPNWPATLVGSLSHSHYKMNGAESENGVCLMATALGNDYLGLGIDIEFFENFEQNLNEFNGKIDVDFRKSILNDAELILLNQFNVTNGVAKVFSAKESLYKMLSPLGHNPLSKTCGVIFEFLDLRLSKIDCKANKFYFQFSSQINIETHDEHKPQAPKLPELEVEVLEISFPNPAVFSFCSLKKNNGKKVTELIDYLNTLSPLIK